MNIIVGVQSEQGMEIMGTKEGKPLVFTNEEQAVEFLTKETGLTEEIIALMFSFADVTDEELAEINEAMAEQVGN